MADMMHPPFRHSDSNCLTGVNTAETLLYALTNQDEPLFTSAISGAEPDDVSAVSGGTCPPTSGSIILFFSTSVDQQVSRFSE